MLRFNFNHGDFTLGKLVSSAGMRYQSSQRVLEGPRRNEIILTRIKDAGVNMDKQSVDIQLAAMVRGVREELGPFISFNMRPKNMSDLLDTAQKMRRVPEWAIGLSDSTFFELFWRLIEARKQWQNNPAPPFNAWEQSPVAAEVDAFLAAVPQVGENTAFEWIHTEWEFHELAGGLDSDEDEVEDEGKDEKQKEEEAKAEKQKAEKAKAEGQALHMKGLKAVVGEMQKAEEAKAAMEDGFEKMDLS